MNKPLKVWFGYTQNMGVTYYRFIQFAKYMRKIPNVEVAYSDYKQYDGISAEWQHQLKDPIILKQLEMLVKTADIVVIGFIKDMMGLAFIQACKEKFKKKFLMEFDDYVFNLPASNIASNAYKPGGTLEWILKKQMKMVDGMIVSTNYLKNAYAKYNDNIHIVPNGIDLEMWGAYEKPTVKENLTIGFAGSPNHAGDIRLIKPAIVSILAKYPKVKFAFLGCNPEFIKHERVSVKDNWKPIMEYPKYLKEQGFDIAIAPLKDNFFNRGKSNLRYLEMSMLGIPTVASRIIPYQETIKNARTGFLCSNIDEWITSLSILIEDKDKREKMGKEAYDFVVQNYNVKNTANKYVQILQNEVNNG